MAAQEIIDDLVSKEALESIDKLEKSLDGTLDVFKKNITEAGNLYAELNKLGKSYSALYDFSEKYNKVQDDIAKTEAQQKAILTEKEKLIQKIRQSQTEETKVVTRLKLEYQQRTKEVKNQIQAENSHSTSINKMRQLLAGLVIEYNKASDSARKKMAPAMKELQDRINAANAEIGRSQGFVGQYGNALAGVGKQLMGAFGVVGGVVLLTNAIKNGISTIKDFEQANANLATILGTSRSNIIALTENAKELGRTTEYTASQVTKLQTELAKLGFNEREILNATKPILGFATALQADLGEAAEVAGAALRAFGMDSSETERAVSVMTIAANKSALSFGYIQTALSTVAPVAKAFNFTIEDTMALLGTLSDAGFDASSAATATRNIILNLADSSGALAKALGAPVKSLDDLVPALIKLRNSGIDLNGTLELTDKRSVAAFNRFLDGAESIAKLRKELDNTEGVLDRIRKEQLDTLDGSLKLLNSAWEGLMLSFSNSAGPMKTAVEWLTSVVEWLNKASIAANDFNKVPTETSFYSQEIKDIRQNETELFDRSFSQNIEKGYDPEMIYKIEKAKAEKYLNEQSEDLDQFMINRQRAITAGIIKADEWSKADSKYYNDTRLAIDGTKASLEALEDVYKKFQKPEETTKNNTYSAPLSDKELKEAKKRAEANRKAIAELNILGLQKESDAFKRIVDDEKKGYEQRFQAVVDYNNKQVKIINTKRDSELKAEGITQEQRSLINMKADYEIEKSRQQSLDTIKKITDSAYKKLYEGFEKQINDTEMQMQKEMQKEMDALTKQYTSRKITQEQYEKEKAAIVKKYAIQSYQTEIQYLKDALVAFEGDVDLRDKLAKNLANLELEYEKFVTNGIKKEFDERKTLYDKFMKFLNDKRTQAALEAFSMASDIASTHYDNEIQKLEDRDAREKELYEEKQAEIDQMREDGLITEEEAAARKTNLDNAEAQREKQIAQQKRELQIKQARWEKANALVQAGINISQAVLKAYAEAGPIAGPILAGVIAALGAVQLAQIASKQIPEYAEGTGFHPGGLAIVGDGGRSELVSTPQGKMYKTSDKPTLVDLPRGSVVYPDFNAVSNMPPLPVYHDNPGSDFAFDEELRKTGRESLNEMRKFNRNIEVMRKNSMFSESKISTKFNFRSWQ